ncbi:LysR family transcriptional regulator [Amycolatopsis sp. CA-230715]|uniref:LysR family transcriptional regulator n=1 Tax=Amycolatopsis sp. CA-230715 TaxID=2745196 RepID=UPI001C038EAD|nr:LysR family transcriptional regulator [Amycolatopsis sp. CA-230715]QWF84903.1 HTH-type transcriptional regulator CatM [Amycolatopsis sp. CA-230715]
MGTTNAAPSAEFDLRLVRYFTVVAEQQHFGRAAVLLHVTQPTLSRQIRTLEQRVGARLLDRDRQGTRLTPAGAAFLPHARQLLAVAATAAAAASAAAVPSRVTVGHTRGLIITPAVRQLRHDHPEAEVHTQHLELAEVRTALFGHRVDAVVTRLPFATDGLRVTVLHHEPRVLLVAGDHRLAGRESVTLDDIATEPMPRLPNAEWDSFWRVDPRPDGTSAPDGPLVGHLEDSFDLIASGRAVAIVPAGLRADSARPDLTSIPLHGVEPCQVVLATRVGDTANLVAAFRRSAQTLLVGEGY